MTAQLRPAMLRLGLSLLAGLTFSLLTTLLLKDAVGLQTSLDLAFFFAVPVVAVAAAVYLATPALRPWWGDRALGVLGFLLLPAAIVGLAVAPVRIATAAGIAGPALAALVAYALMLPAAPAIERRYKAGEVPVHVAGLVLAAPIVLVSIGFLHPVIASARAAFAFALAAGTVVGWIGSRLAGRIRGSLRSGVLHRPLNRFLCLLLLALPVAIATLAARFPPVSPWDALSLPATWLGSALAGFVLAGVWLAPVGQWASATPAFQRLRRSGIAAWAGRQFPGFFLTGVFGLAYLLLAISLNRPGLGLNTVLFESDAGQWLEILGSPGGEALNRSVHPLVLITIRPLVRLVAALMGQEWRLGALLVVACVSAASVFMFWRILERAAGNRTFAFLYAALFGATATQMLLGSLVETFAFSVASLVGFWLLIQAREHRLAVLVPAGVLTFGITISNLAQPLIGLLSSGFGLRRLLRFLLLTLSAAVVLTSAVDALFPSRQTLFYVPSDLAFERRFVQAAGASASGDLSGRAAYVLRTMFLYGVVGPSPVAVIAAKDPRATLDMKTLDSRSGKLASYDGFANLPLGLWIILLAGAAVSAARQGRALAKDGLLAGLAGSLLFTFCLHLFYGTEMFLYTPYSTYALVLCVALALRGFAGRPWFEYALSAFLGLLIVNNLGFLMIILRAVSPFFLAAS